MNRKAAEARRAAQDLLSVASDTSGTRCVVALYVRDMLSDGRIAEAHALVASTLRSGRVSRELQLMAADMLTNTPTSGARGRPPYARPKRWMDIGSDFDARLQKGMSWDHAKRELAGEYHMSESHIDKAYCFFKLSNKYNRIERNSLDVIK